MVMKDKKSKILVVEDDSIVAMDIRKSLNHFGYAVISPVSSGEKALESIEKNRPNLVMMDIMLAGKMDGITVAEKINARYDIPVIYLTAHSDSKIFLRAKKTAPFGYIAKPFHKNDLNIAIQIALHKHKQEMGWKEDLQWFSSVFQSLGDPALIADKKGVIRFVNSSFSGLTGWKAGKVVGQPLKTGIAIYDERGNEIKITFVKFLREDVYVEMGFVELAGKGNRKIQANLDIAPFKDSKGENLGVALFFRKVDEGVMNHQEKQNMIDNLVNRVSRSGMPTKFLAMCPWCKRASDGDREDWNQLEYHIRDNESVSISHSICPRCLKRLGLDMKKLEEKTQ